MTNRISKKLIELNPDIPKDVLAIFFMQDLDLSLTDYFDVQKFVGEEVARRVKRLRLVRIPPKLASEKV